MQFTTKVPIPKNHHLIDYDSKIVTLGSCFAVNIAEKFNYYKFQNTVNPFGILFHPLAIHEMIQRAIHQDFFDENNVFFHNERWHCFDAHSDLSAMHQQDLLQNLNQKLADLKLQIESASHILITYGTAWVYTEKTSQKVVANCHKVPQTQFEKELLTATKIQETIQDTMALIQSVNPKASITFTVSPVRHLKDGFIENQQSKANLIIGIHQTLNQQLSSANYFPSYEIMMDELRDYRFYAEDLLHPNAIAIQYIWEQFVSSAIAPASFSVMEEVESIQKGLAHRPFHADSESHLKFTAQLHFRIAQLQQQFPKMTF
ncbi:GSCFA domain-containing protein [Flavobacterium sp.]|uniref:GSCFA domain-containing protein n=1 Tax=Flavobacterium sp. TaxID=239 RepID=UPI00286A8D76|nr:GSCFA domain-containing protein [Flavobacterium sp.]